MMEAKDWEAKWTTNGGIIPPGELWDRGMSSPILLKLETRGLLPHEGKALVPGCGRGYDVAFFSKLGLTTTGLEISTSAIKAATDYLTSQGITSEKGNVIERDFFREEEGQESYDLIYDYTFFCAIDPSLRIAWGKRMGQLVKPGGKLVTLIFPIDERAGGPPFAVNPAQVRELLEANGFDDVIFEEIPHELSFEDRKGKEKIAIWVKK